MTMSRNLAQCYDLLNKTGRAFAVTIDYLDEELRDALCLFYLVIRAVDTVEDDTKIPDDTKVTMLTSFDKYLLDPTWRYTGSGDEHGIVLEQFPCVTQALDELPRKYTSIILEVGSQMGQGMAHFVGKELLTIQDMNEYCRRVSYVFCIGFTSLFVAAGLEAEIKDMSLVMQMSLFIQKINRLRDYRKDWMCHKLYYTKDVWGKYVSNLEDFLKPENFAKGVECVNELATDALQHVIPFLQLFKHLKSPSAIKFFGIHKVMGIATLERCYNNPRVFMESVKIGRDVTMNIIETTASVADVLDKVRHYTERIMEHAIQASGTTHNTMDICRQILNHIDLLKSS